MIKVIGYGNPARGDDGLGPACAHAIRALDLEGVDVRVDYQLSVDHALWIADATRVVFLDAAMRSPGAFHFEAIEPATNAALGSHALCPEAVLSLAETLYGATPPAHMLAIAGYEFGSVQEGLSAGATKNLRAASDYLRRWIMNRPRVEYPAGCLAVSSSE